MHFIGSYVFSWFISFYISYNCIIIANHFALCTYYYCTIFLCQHLYNIYTLQTENNIKETIHYNIKMKLKLLTSKEMSHTSRMLLVHAHVHIYVVSCIYIARPFPLLRNTAECKMEAICRKGCGLYETSVLLCWRLLKEPAIYIYIYNTLHWQHKLILYTQL